MRFTAVAFDYDGTLADEGRVADSTFRALERLAANGRKSLLVTGRHLPDLLRICPRLDLFARVVVENGGVLYDPATGTSRLLANPPQAVFAEALRRRGVSPLYIGAVVVATVVPHDAAVLETIRTMGLDLQIIFNRDNVMVLPTGVDKVSGMSVALEELGVPLSSVVAVGDSENDVTMFKAAGFAAATGNAVPELKAIAHYVAEKENGAGSEDIIERLIASEFEDLQPPRR